MSSKSSKFSSKQVCLSVTSKKSDLLEIIFCLPDMRYCLPEIKFPVNMSFLHISSLPDIDLGNN